jgi:ribosomal 30S subunit maturation factor RimM
MIHTGDRAPLNGEDEYYAQDVIGLEVVLSDEGSARDGVVLGIVSDVVDGVGEHDALEIRFAERLACLRDGRLVDVDDLNDPVCTSSTSMYTV